MRRVGPTGCSVMTRHINHLVKAYCHQELGQKICHTVCNLLNYL